MATLGLLENNQWEVSAARHNYDLIYSLRQWRMMYSETKVPKENCTKTHVVHWKLSPVTFLLLRHATWFCKRWNWRSSTCYFMSCQHVIVNINTLNIIFTADWFRNRSSKRPSNDEKKQKIDERNGSRFNHLKRWNCEMFYMKKD